MDAIAPPEIQDALHGLGICPGDWLFFHTSLRSFGAPVENGADGLIDAVYAAVSPGGTIAVPTHAPARPTIFDPKHTPPEADIGVLPHVFVARSEAIRSCHPTHSAAAMGTDARAWMAGHEHCRATGPGSPLDRLRRHPRGKVLLIGVGLERLTLIHLAENLARVPYVGPAWSERDPATVPVRTWDGTIVDVENLETPGCSECFGRAEDALRAAGLIQEAVVGQSRFMVMPAGGVIDQLLRLLESDSLFLLNDPGHCDWCRRANLRART